MTCTLFSLLRTKLAYGRSNLKTIKRSSHQIVELRTYESKPEFSKGYLNLAAETAAIRKKYFGDNWKLFLRAETGYGTLGDFMHIYTYENLQHRSEVRNLLAKDLDWQIFLDKSRPCLRQQRSELFQSIEIPSLGIKNFSESGSFGPDTIYEIRHYQLVPGYDSVPNLINIFCQGLPDKLAACGSLTGELILLAHSDISILNQFVEIWRYPSPSSCIIHREASRNAKIWRSSIAEAAKITVAFQNRIMIPTTFSPIK